LSLLFNPYLNDVFFWSRLGTLQVFVTWWVIAWLYGHPIGVCSCALHMEPMEAMYYATYEDSNQWLMACMVLQGNEYKHDNTCVWDILHPLIYGTSAMGLCQDLEQEARWLKGIWILQCHGEGDVMRDVHSHKVEEIIKKAHYDGQSRCFTLQSYIYLL
jgi:hypothetical protein